MTSSATVSASATPMPQTQTISPAGRRRRQVIASLLGEPSFEQINWRRLMQDGVLVRLQIRRCRFSTRLTLDDLGLRVEDDAVRTKLAQWLVLGEKRLLPQGYMKSLARLESGARYALKERAFRTELGAFVPATAYVDWRETTQSLQAQYFALRDEILLNHRSLVREVLAEYEVIAQDTYQRLSQTHPESLTQGQAAFVTQYTNRIAAQIPTPERIRETFAFSFLLVDGRSQLDSVSEGDETQVQEAQASVTDVRNQAQERVWQRAVLQEDLRRHAQERVTLALDSFLSSVVGHLRGLLYESCCDVLATLERRGNGSFAPQSVSQLSHLVTHLRTLNFYGDAEIERMMQQLEQIVEQSPSARQASLADIGRTLRAIATVTRSTLLDLEEEPRAARELAIAAIPTEAAVRQARAELGLDLETSHFASLMQVRTDVRAERAEGANQGMESLWQGLERTPQRAARLL